MSEPKDAKELATMLTIEWYKNNSEPQSGKNTSPEQICEAFKKIYATVLHPTV